jgi:hypothetical protein
VADKQKELEASASLGETSLWIEALAEDADEDEVANLARVLNAEIYRFIADSSHKPLCRSLPLRGARLPSPGLRGCVEGCRIAAWERTRTHPRTG